VCRVSSQSCWRTMLEAHTHTISHPALGADSSITHRLRFNSHVNINNLYISHTCSSSWNQQKTLTAALHFHTQRENAFCTIFSHTRALGSPILSYTWLKRLSRVWNFHTSTLIRANSFQDWCKDPSHKPLLIAWYSRMYTGTVSSASLL
jgi:hypothetical protein